MIEWMLCFHFPRDSENNYVFLAVAAEGNQRHMMRAVHSLQPNYLFLQHISSKYQQPQSNLLNTPSTF